ETQAHTPAPRSERIDVVEHNAVGVDAGGFQPLVQFGFVPRAVQDARAVPTPGDVPSGVAHQLHSREVALVLDEGRVQPRDVGVLAVHSRAPGSGSGQRSPTLARVPALPHANNARRQRAKGPGRWTGPSGRRPNWQATRPDNAGGALLFPGRVDII